MKILVISDLYPPYYVGGYEINCRDAVDALVERGHQVDVLTSTWGLKEKGVQENIHRLLDYDPTFLESKINNHSHLVDDICNRLLQLKRILISRRNYLITQNVILDTHPEVVFLWHLGNVTVTPALAAQDINIPTCFRIEDYSFARMKKFVNEEVAFHKKFYRSIVFGKKDIDRLQFTNLLFISKYVKDFYSNAGYPKSGMRVLPSGLPSMALRDPVNRPHSPFSATDGVIRLVFIGRVEPEKGPDIAIKALAMLKSENKGQMIYLEIIGGGGTDYIEYLKKMTGRLGITNKVSFLGKLRQDEIINRFESYDALLFTSRWEEPFGRIVIEAMAHGLPVVATQTGGVPEIIDDCENGLLVPPENPKYLANVLETLFKSPEFAARLSRNAFTTVRACYTIEQISARMEEYISSIVSISEVNA